MSHAPTLTIPRVAHLPTSLLAKGEISMELIDGYEVLDGHLGLLNRLTRNHSVTL